MRYRILLSAMLFALVIAMTLPPWLRFTHSRRIAKIVDQCNGVIHFNSSLSAGILRFAEQYFPGNLIAFFDTEIYMLHADGNEIDDAFLSELKRYPITDLSIHGPGITDKGMRSIAQISLLEDLHVESPLISDDGLAAR